MLYDIIPYKIIPHYTILYFTILYYTILIYFLINILYSRKEGHIMTAESQWCKVKSNDFITPNVWRPFTINRFDRYSYSLFETFKTYHRKTKRGMKHPISFDGSVSWRGRCRPLTKSKMKQFFSLVAGFVLISSKYISEHLPMTASEK